MSLFFFLCLIYYTQSCQYIGLSVTNSNGLSFKFGYPLNQCGGYAATAINTHQQASIKFKCEANGTSSIPYVYLYDTGDCSGTLTAKDQLYKGYQIYWANKDTYFTVSDYNCGGATCDSINLNFYYSSTGICSTNNNAYFKASAVIDQCLYPAYSGELASFKLICDANSLTGTYYENTATCSTNGLSRSIKNKQCLQYDTTYPTDRLYVTLDCNNTLASWQIILIVVGGIAVCLICCACVKKCKQKRNSGNVTYVLQTEGNQYT